MSTAGLGMTRPLVPQFQAEALEVAERELATAMRTLDATRGRAGIDNNGIGVAKMLMQKSLISIRSVREQLAKTEAA